MGKKFLIVSDELHRKLKLLSVKKGVSLREIAEEAIRDFLKKHGVK